jgi:hypothetical protein
VFFPFLDAEDIALEVVSGIGCGDVEIAILQNDKQVVVVVKLAEGCAVLVVVDTIDIGIPPYLSSAQGRASVRLESNLVYRVLRQDVTLG